MLYVVEKAFYRWFLFENVPNLNAIYQFTNAYNLLVFLKLYKISHLSMLALRIKLVHLCVFKNEFDNFRLFRDWDIEIIRVPRASDQVNQVLRTITFIGNSPFLREKIKNSPFTVAPWGLWQNFMYVALKYQ